MIDYLTHYFNKISAPFLTLSALTDSEALEIMNTLCDDSPLFSRFKAPVQYMENRSKIEKWLRTKFIEKGCKPIADYPIYGVLGYPYWIEKHANDFGYDTSKIQLPLSIFSEDDISFTVPDSMVTYSLEMEKPIDHYNPEYHGQVFTLTEAKSFMNTEFLDFLEKTLVPGGSIPYVEVQIWNHKLIKDYCGAK